MAMKRTDVQRGADVTEVDESAEITFETASR